MIEARGVLRDAQSQPVLTSVQTCVLPPEISDRPGAGPIPLVGVVFDVPVSREEIEAEQQRMKDVVEGLTKLTGSAPPEGLTESLTKMPEIGDDDEIRRFIGEPLYLVMN